MHAFWQQLGDGGEEEVKAPRHGLSSRGLQVTA
ncbi:uncharacterized protein G2W53_025428 [Senna tora]|uniref:Uncharacterized protein n=1 Tax=Senna tora TaxID=362788 RepID=A0A834TD32_9FABA|nr:uncharacterized protein G2W53_025428 [Senna tora]